MEGNIFRYIQILLPQYQCVTIPGLGAFIVNNELASGVRRYGKIMPPTYKLSFNSQLMHDDGIVTSFYQQLKNTSYEKASQELNKEVKRLKALLSIGDELTCGELGTLIQKNDSLIFGPNQSYFLPSVFGLTAVSLLNLEEINLQIKQKERSNRRVILRRNILSTVTAAALVGIFFFPTNAIQDTDPGIEQANFLRSVSSAIHTPGASNAKNSISIGEMNKVVSSNISENTSSKTADGLENTVNNIVDEENTTTKKYYFLIVGGDASEERANKILENIKKEGFTEASIIPSTNRYRVSVEQFENKGQAEQAIINLRKAYPRYASAWIYSKTITE